MCTMYMPVALRGQKRSLDPQELEFQAVVSCHVGAGNRAWVLYNRSKCCSPAPSLNHIHKRIPDTCNVWSHLTYKNFSISTWLQQCWILCNIFLGFLRVWNSFKSLTKVGCEAKQGGKCQQSQDWRGGGRRIKSSRARLRWISSTGCFCRGSWIYNCPSFLEKPKPTYQTQMQYTYTHIGSSK